MRQRTSGSVFSTRISVSGLENWQTGIRKRDEFWRSGRHRLALPATDIFHIISILFNCRDTSLRVAEAMICFFDFGARTRPQDLLLFLISETGLKMSFLAWTQGEISIDKRAHMKRPLYSSRLHGNIYSGTPLYRHPFITDSFGCHIFPEINSPYS